MYRVRNNTFSFQRDDDFTKKNYGSAYCPLRNTKGSK